MTRRIIFCSFTFWTALKTVMVFNADKNIFNHSIKKSFAMFQPELFDLEAIYQVVKSFMTKIRNFKVNRRTELMRIMVCPCMFRSKMLWLKVVEYWLYFLYFILNEEIIVEAAYHFDKVSMLFRLNLFISVFWYNSLAVKGLTVAEKR